MEPVREWKAFVRRLCGDAQDAVKILMGLHCEAESASSEVVFFFDVFAIFFANFASFSKFSDVFRPVWTPLDLFGCIRIRSDA